jgi:hypothetical protein
LVVLALGSRNRTAQAQTASDPIPERAAGREPEHVAVGALAGVGFPRPLALEGLVRLDRLVALGAEYSVLPGVTISGAQMSFWALSAAARVFPFRNSFFVGASAGYQHLGASETIRIMPTGSVEEALAVDTWFINPRIGFLWAPSAGLAVGIDSGLQIPVASSTSSTLPAGVSVSDPVASVADTLGRGVLPTINLLRVGALF